MRGIPIFYLLFFYIIIIWFIDINALKKYYFNSLLFFILFGLYYVLISYLEGFNYIFGIPVDTNFILRQSYFLPYIGLAIPVFTRSFNYGMFNFLLKKNILFIVIAFYFFPYSILFTALLLYSIKNNKIALAIFFLISFLFVLSDNMAFQILLSQLFLLTCFIFKVNFNFKYVSISIVSIIVILYLASYPLAILLSAIDSNSGWRIILWVDNIKSTINDTFLLGHGFGTSYFAADGRLPGDFIPLIGAEETLRNYSTPYVAEFVLAQHNSFINLFYRLGISGLLLFLMFINKLANQINKSGAPYQLKYILLISMIIISVNVGLESPGFATQFALIIGLIQYYIISYQEYPARIGSAN